MGQCSSEVEGLQFGGSVGTASKPPGLRRRLSFQIRQNEKPPPPTLPNFVRLPILSAILAKYAILACHSYTAKNCYIVLTLYISRVYE